MKKSAFLCFLLLVLTLFMACTDGVAIEQENTDTESVSETVELTPLLELPKMDFKGRSFVILAGEYSSSTKTQTFFIDEDDGDVLNGALYFRNLALKERFNMTFKNVKCSADDMISGRTVKASIQAGDDAYDMAVVLDRGSLKLGMDGMLQPYTDLSYVDIDKPWWYENVSSYLSIDNKLFFTFGYHSIESFDALNVLLFNKTIADNRNFENPYSLIADGKWTIDALYSMMKSVITDLNGDGKMDDSDLWGANFYVNEWYNNFGPVSGAYTITKDIDDLPLLSVVDNVKLINIWQKLKDYADQNLVFNMSTAKVTIYNKGFAYDNAMEMFAAGHTLFTGTYCNYIASLKNMTDEFGIIPYPKYVEVDAGSVYYGYTSGGWPLVVPVTNTRIEETGAVLEAMAYESYLNVIPKYYEVVLLVKQSRDIESANMLRMMNENRVMDLGETYWYETVFLNMHTCFNNSKADFISEFTKAQPKAQKAIDDAISAFQAMK
jgi:hypothetical protein